ncbi:MULTISPECIES: TetR/AcrR family transcriptional regulator [unclassified Paenibacillus]|uniref:TetR/AcrR family transcriptional regulator n=1 Tax=unclassified Paenibacillus TaxID=185978 RepID=UPI0007104EBA|nr:MULTISPECIES: TetR/AcrR family transcriptional regulator [unclassified Paenibacillus]KQX46809.1 TetR family transcriptional regulator [Paenibacillus sp. Root444D2]KRE34254.1 TetR family transcriptional regulator [Paenibacillus sp. Soil724D2]
MNNRTSRTDPRILRTRQLLKDAFVELLQEMDIEKISVNRIAERATINRVTFYLHYRDIPDMLEKMADDMIGDINGILNCAPGNQNSTEEEDWPLLVNLLEHIAEHAKFYKVILASKRTPIFTERLLKLLTELVTARVERMGNESFLSTVGIQKDIAIWYGSSALIGTIVAWLRKDMPYTPLYLAKQFTLLRSQ